MSGVEFERRDRRDRSNGDELIPRVSRETIDIARREYYSEVPGGDHHRAATFLERIRGVNPIVAEYIERLAQQIPEERYSYWVVQEGVLVYRVLELEFAQRGKEMPIVRREIAGRLKVNIAQEERHFETLAISLVRENYELLQSLALSAFWATLLPSREVPLGQIARLVLESALGVYALIKDQAELDRFSSLWSSQE
jgi:hypothetical protein